MPPTDNQGAGALTTRQAKEALHGHAGLVVALTGLPAAGKTTLAGLLEEKLIAAGISTAVLDGDVMRRGLCADLGFSPAERGENLRRLGQVAAIMLQAGLVVLVAAIMPLEDDRQRLRAPLAPADYLEVFVSCDLATCQARDPKGHYARARQGLIPHFTGVSAPYEAPRHPDLIVRTDQEPAAMAAKRVYEAIARRVLARPAPAARRRA